MEYNNNSANTSFSSFKMFSYDLTIFFIFHAIIMCLPIKVLHHSLKIWKIAINKYVLKFHIAGQPQLHIVWVMRKSERILQKFFFKFSHYAVVLWISGVFIKNNMTFVKSCPLLTFLNWNYLKTYFISIIAQPSLEKEKYC